MKAILKIAVLPALLLALASVAYADSVTLNSAGCVSATCANGALKFLGTSSLAHNGTGGLVAPPSPTSIPANVWGTFSYNVPYDTGGWLPAISGSSWVSNSQLGGNGATADGIPNDFYYYQTTFSAAGGVDAYSGSISVMADDTAEVLLNGTPLPLVNFALPNPNGPCAQGGGGPTCNSVYTIALNGITLLSGANTLTIIDAQTNGYGEAVDVSTNLATPEPSSLLLLGTGLLGLAFVAFRKAKSSGLVLHS